MRRRTFISSLISGFAGLAAAAALSSAAFARNYPNRPVVIVVPFAPGGAFDVLARELAPRMGELLGQQVLVENVTGASGMVGSTRVAHATPDGYTVLLASIGTHAYNPSIYKTIAYDAVGDFTPVGLVAEQPMVLVARKDLPVGEPQGIHRLCEGQPRQDAVRLRRHRLDHALELRAGQCRDGRAPGACALPRRRAGDGRDRRRAHGLRLLQHRRRCRADQGRQPEGHRHAVARARRDPARPAERARTGPHRFQRDDLERLARAQRHAAGNRRQAQRGDEQDARYAAVQELLAKHGVAGVAPERRSPAYLAKFIPEEIARWAGPIKAAGIEQDESQVA